MCFECSTKNSANTGGGGWGGGAGGAIIKKECNHWNTSATGNAYIVG